MTKRLGIIQPGRIGDIIICLPIAHFYYRRGIEILWPIDERFLPMFREVAPWVKWIPVCGGDGKGRVVAAKNIMKSQKNEYLDIQSTSGIRNMRDDKGHIIHFDQLKYLKAKVPFEEKWRLPEMVTEPDVDSKLLFNRLKEFWCKKNEYSARHIYGSNWAAAAVDMGRWFIDITPHESPSVFHWLDVLRNAKEIICVDSCIANLVEGMGINRPRTFITRSDAWLTPVLRPGWSIVTRDGKRVDPRKQY